MTDSFSHSPSSPGISMNYKDAVGLLTIRLSEAKHLQFHGFKRLFTKGDPFAEVMYGKTRFFTKTIPGTDSPQWNEDVRLWVYDATKSYKLQLSVFDDKDSDGDDTNNTARKGKIIGRGFVSIESMITSSAQSKELWVALSEKVDALTDKDGASIATIDAPPPVKSDQQALRLTVSFTPKAELEKTFFEGLWQHFDTDNSGTLDRVEVMAMFDTLRLKMKEEEIDEFLKEVDSSGDGELEKDELLRLFNSDGFQSHPMSTHLLTYLLDGKEGLDNMVNGVCDAVTMKQQKGNQVASIEAGGIDDIDDMGLIVFDRNTGLLLHENIPSYIKVALKSMYRTTLGRKITKSTHVREMLVNQSIAEGAKMNHPSSKAKIAPFITLHGLNPADFRLPVSEYEHFNAFFYRQLREGLRPAYEPNNPASAVSPADCRMTVFPNINDSRTVWIKGKNFSVENLLGPRKDLAAKMQECSLVIARLAPQDYHRFHFPVTGKVASITEITGTLYTVNPVAIRQKIDVYTENVRHVIEIHTHAFGTVIMIAVGATLVGSVNVLPQYKTPGAEVRKGDEAGYFAFGGSTTLVLFEKDSIKLDADLVENSVKPIEVLIQVGQSIGTSLKV